MRKIGEDVAEVLDYVPARFRVIHHVRPKLTCPACERIVQMEAPSRPIARGLAGAGLLAHVLVSKYADHLPLYRQAQIYAREGVEIERSTMAEWVAGCFRLLDPLVEALARYVMSNGKLHADDTPVPVLDPGRGVLSVARSAGYATDSGLRRVTQNFLGASPSALRDRGAIAVAAAGFTEVLRESRLKARITTREG